MKDSAPEADGVKYGEIRGRFPERSEGARPIRKRGYHRALKRGEIWAHTEQAHRESLSRLNKMMFTAFESRINEAIWNDNLSFLRGLK